MPSPSWSSWRQALRTVVTARPAGCGDGGERAACGSGAGLRLRWRRGRIACAARPSVLPSDAALGLEGSGRDDGMDGESGLVVGDRMRAGLRSARGVCRGGSEGRRRRF